MGVSIVIPSFERPELLDRLLQSIANQTYKEFEVFVVDDNSSNFYRVEQVVNKYSKEFKIELTKNKKKMGAPFSRNKGINLAQNDLIALVDDDDEWFPLKLEKQIEVFKNSGDEVGLVYTWTRVIDSSRNILREATEVIEGIAKNEILDNCFISSPSVMVRKKAIIKAGLFDESFPSCQDWDTWTRIIFNNYEIRVCSEFLTYYYKHDGPTIGTSPRAKEGFILYYQKHFFKLLRFGKFRHLIRFFRLKVGI
ncbi:MAG: glycosyltransferase family 2 protein [Bacteriovorax sp.]|nr:glycosyltransferase family 2 protein [Bacteriovorax sp.]